MRRITRRTSMMVGAAAALALTLSACGSDGEETTTEGSSSQPDNGSSADQSAGDTSDEEQTESGDDTDEMAGPVGPGCAGYAEQVPDGPGSVEGMSDDPVATAASNNPLLGTLVSAVSGDLNPDVNLVDTLNGDEFTVFAPVDDAFSAVDEETLNTLSEDADLLTTVLTYHVVPGQIGPGEIIGEHETVQGETVTVDGEPEMLTVNDAEVICGGVQTANATVYLIDSVLMPSME